MFSSIFVIFFAKLKFLKINIIFSKFQIEPWVFEFSQKTMRFQAKQKTKTVLESLYFSYRNIARFPVLACIVYSLSKSRRLNRFWDIIFNIVRRSLKFD